MMTQKIISTKPFIEKRFPDEEAANTFFFEKRWGKDIKCTYCTSDRVYLCKTKQPFKCNNCNKKFTTKTGTIMEGSHIEIRTWLFAMYLMCTSRKGLSSIEFASQLGTTQRTAWFIAQRILEACHEFEKQNNVKDTFISLEKKNKFTYKKNSTADIKHRSNESDNSINANELRYHESKTNLISLVAEFCVKVRSGMVNYVSLPV